jgi:hypothetical protein
MRYRLTIKLIPLLLLGGCMGATSPAPIPPAAPMAPAPTFAPATEPTAAPRPAPAPLPAPKPSRLSGLNPKQVQALMGTPSLVRRDGAMQVMLFEQGPCVFEIIFYEPTPDTHFRAEHLNARDRNGTDTDLQTCLVGLLPNGQWLDTNTTDR